MGLQSCKECGRDTVGKCVSCSQPVCDRCVDYYYYVCKECYDKLYEYHDEEETSENGTAIGLSD